MTDVLQRLDTTCGSVAADPRDTSNCVRILPCQQDGAADLFFSERPAQLEEAKVLCADCPLRQQCLEGALERAEPWGVWGGNIFEAGRVIAVKRGRGRPRKNAA
jgi:WhiB family redox-sensing transcriptional regulator